MPEPGYYTIDELMAVCLARTIRERDFVFNGVAVALPFAAIALAKKSHAPNCAFLGGLPAGVDPELPFIPPTSGDSVMLAGAATILPLHEIFDLAQKGLLDRIFFGGAQVDQYGNLNNTLIGTPEQIKVKLPGGAGASNIGCFARHFTVWTSRHRVRPNSAGRKAYTLVERVDFITTVGHVTPQGTRRELGLRGGGPDWLVTDLAVFDFNPQGRLRLQSIHPGFTRDEVLASTGFEPDLSGEVGVTPPPTQAEVELIRRLDPLRARQREFTEAQLSVRYPL